MSAHVEVPRRALVLALAAVVLAVGAGFAYAYLPSATISITPASFQESVTQEILLSTSVNEPDFTRYRLPARVVEATVEENQEVRRSGGTAKPDIAAGTVTLINNQDEEQPLLPKSHLRHEQSGTFFLTDNAVRLPPQGRLDVRVHAKEPGASSNVPPGRFIVDKLPASLQAQVYGESSVALTGGEVFDTPLTEDDLAAALKQVQEASSAKARGELVVAAGGTPIREDLVTIETVEERSSASPGSRATSFNTTVRIRARAFVVDENDLLSLTLLALRAAPEADEELVEYQPESFTAKIVSANFERGEARVATSLTGTFAQKTPGSVLSTDNLAGRTPTEVAEYYRTLEGVGDVEVKLSPFWVRTVPSRRGAVEVVLRTRNP